jgi:hypothetical protein
MNEEMKRLPTTIFKTAFFLSSITSFLHLKQ